MQKIELTDSNIERQYFTQVTDQMYQITSSLRNLGIMHFTYWRIMPNQSVTNLTTHPACDISYVRNRFYESALAGEPEQYNSGMVFYDDLLIDEDKTALQALKSSYMQLAYVRPDLIIFDKSDNYVDCYLFGTPLDNRNIHSFYLNNLGLLKKFIIYFHDRGRHLLKEAHKLELIYPGSGKEQSLLSSPKWQEKMLSSFKEIAHDSNSSFIFYLSKKHRFTKKESLIAFYLQTGFTPKEISYELNISNRTTEKHVVNLKEKMRSRSMAHLIAQLNQCDFLK